MDQQNCGCVGQGNNGNNAAVVGYGYTYPHTSFL